MKRQTGQAWLLAWVSGMLLGGGLNANSPAAFLLGVVLAGISLNILEDGCSRKQSS